MYTGQGPEITKECTDAFDEITKHFSSMYQRTPLEYAVVAAFLLEIGMFGQENRQFTAEERVSFSVATREISYFAKLVESMNERVQAKKPLYDEPETLTEESPKSKVSLACNHGVSWEDKCDLCDKAMNNINSIVASLESPVTSTNQTNCTHGVAWDKYCLECEEIRKSAE
jgi:hypothetical protein